MTKVLFTYNNYFGPAVLNEHLVCFGLGAVLSMLYYGSAIVTRYFPEFGEHD